jgi:PTH1 family peptidyl-tRNA hydrolase
MRLLVGLGNPGAEYEKTRHNAGFMVVDRLQRRFLGTAWQKKFKGEMSDVRDSAMGPEGRAILLKPLTYMNLSGTSVRPAVDFYKLTAPDVVVLHDELDLPLGTLRVKVGGGHGGHNGLRSIHEHLGPDYVRIRLGIGKPGGKGEHVVGHVLGGFSKLEQVALEGMLDQAEAALLTLMKDGTQKAMNQFNQKA